ncbi:MAG: penicillin acylase family protein, partial [Pseudomonadales bacterium]|nr:penicillin acylase family protein [Pseudomonadales bacterium]
RYTRMATIDWLGTGSDPGQRLQIFAGTLAELTTDFGSWATPWGEINRYQRLDGAIEPHFDDSAASLGIPMASGNWGALASFGAPRRDDVRRLYGRSGNSFVAVVEFGERLKAKSLLAGGQSGSADSPHFSDQAERYAAADFKEVAFYREDVERRAARRYRPGRDAATR